MIKRIFDIGFSLAGLILSSPIWVTTAIIIWFQDFKTPFYMAPRVGKNGRLFVMVKLRSMVIGADQTKVDSTSKRDSRITPIGRMIRAFKLDELLQLWNVLKEEMSIVGPRPNVERETDLYTQEEKELLSIKPGITDLSSIVFADEGEILKDSIDPDLDYNQLIRPWKSRLGLLYVRKRFFLLDMSIIMLTVISIFSRELALGGVCFLLKVLNADDNLIEVAKRETALKPCPPPGASSIVLSRKYKSDYNPTTTA